MSHQFSPEEQAVLRIVQANLPDSLTLPLLWAGLLAAATGLTGTPLPQAVWGAAIGYASLRLVYEIFLHLTGREGMGHGDFKLYAAIGAWLGWPALLPVLLVASVSGLVVGLMLKFYGRLGEQGQLPFGPFLALGGALGAIAVVTKHEIVLAIVGGLFVVEALSVIIQVLYFKRTGKRVFLMAPIHHHFEKKGWKESQIVIRFWIIALVLALIGLATLKLR